MKEIKILHLFPQLLSLYGEYANVAMLAKTLRDAGCAVTVEGYENGPLDLSCDMVYVGAGTEDNLQEALKRLLPYAKDIAQSVNDGTLWLATGNAMTRFGKAVTRRQQTEQGLGVFEYTTEIDDTQRFLGDVLTDDHFAGAQSIGFVNSSCIYKGIASPLLRFALGAKLGNDKISAADGIWEKNFYGTGLIGPLLVKNPHILSHIFQALTGEPLQIPEDSYMKKAYGVSLAELRALQAKEA